MSIQLEPSSSRLPPEIFPSIIEHLSDDKDLHACSLASSWFRKPCQAKLFAKFQIVLGASTPADQKRTQAFRGLLKQTPVVAQYIRFLAFVIWGPDDLLVYLTDLPHLTCLVIQAQTPFPDTMLAATLRLLRLPTLMSVGLASQGNPLPAQLVMYCEGIPSLELMSSSRKLLDADRSTVGQQLHIDRNKKLERLFIGRYGGHMEELFETLFHPSSQVKLDALRSLSTQTFGIPSSPRNATQRLLDLAAGSLSILSLKLRADSPGISMTLTRLSKLTQLRFEIPCQGEISMMVSGARLLLDTLPAENSLSTLIFSLMPISDNNTHGVAPLTKISVPRYPGIEWQYLDELLSGDKFTSKLKHLKIDIVENNAGEKDVMFANAIAARLRIIARRPGVLLITHRWTKAMH
ncbi:hypothetical protein DXG01_010391 [Tephrocybe rancida]|nr:hypothetical protein DXG01_010391 [Tephrocybe rancida]